MKLFQRLLVAPAALGLMAPMAANADITSVSIESEVIDARVDGIEAQLEEIQAGSFSSTTTLSGKSAFVVGSVDNDNNSTDTDELTFNYMYQLNLNSSFTGEDNLYTRIKTGNFNTRFDNKVTGEFLSESSDPKVGDDGLMVDKLWYTFPIGESVTAWVGPKIENYYMLASAPSIYKPVTKQFALGGNGSAYGSSTSPGFGAAWTQSVDDPSDARFAVSANWTSKDGASATDTLGLGGSAASTFLLTKVEYGSPSWQVSLATSFKDNAATAHYDGYFHTAAAEAMAGDITAYGLRAYWKPDTTGSIPSVQVGYDVASSDNAATNAVDETEGWMIGLNWTDIFMDGNRAGFAYGSRQHATGYNGTGTDPAKDNSVWEAYYTFKVNDGVSVTPAVFGGSDVEAADKDVSGAVLLTEFRF